MDIYHDVLRDVQSLGVQDISTIEKIVDRISSRYGYEPITVAQAMYGAIAGGVPESSISEVLNIASREHSRQMPDVSLLRFVEFGVGMVNSFGNEYSEMSIVYDEVEICTFYGCSPFSDLDYITRLAPLCRAADMSSSDMFMLIARLTLNGMKSDMIIESILKNIHAIIKPEPRKNILQRVSIRVRRLFRG